ncbi:hypothetical protein TNCV_4229211 [Trichonephila clavipes]|nr:hypothetical protein TNCV_4229211 [Trichonephila clavipes]
MMSVDPGTSSELQPLRHRRSEMVDSDIRQETDLDCKIEAPSLPTSYSPLIKCLGAPLDIDEDIRPLKIQHCWGEGCLHLENCSQHPLSSCLLDFSSLGESGCFHSMLTNFPYGWKS